MAFGFRSLLSELKRRKVYHVAAAYAAVGVAIGAAVPDVFGALNAPHWAAGLVIVLVIIGFPVALVLAWAVEVTPEGIRRTEISRPRHEEVAASGRSSEAGDLRSSAEGREPANGSVAHPESASAPDARSLAVLPFSDLGADPEYRFFNDGVTEDILAHLGKVKALQVTSRTSVMRYKGTDKPIGHIAAELGVANVLEGSVRAVGNRVRVVAQLIDARTDSHLWAETYDRDIEDIFAVQSEIAEAVARALAAELTGEQLEQIREAPTDDIAAYTLFLEGMAIFRTDQPTALPRALALIEAALRIDPHFARAHAGLTIVLVMYPWGTQKLPPRYHERLQTSVHRALELDSSSAFAWLARGTQLWSHERDWLGAERAMSRARELDPNDPYVLLYSTFHTYMLGRFDEATGYLERMAELDHRSPLADMYAFMIETYRAGYGEMELEVPIRKAKALMEAHPGHETIQLYRSIPLSWAERYEEALAAVEASLRSAPDVPLSHGMRGAMLAALGRMEEARQEEEWFRSGADSQSADRFCWAIIPFAMEELDRGFDLLEEGVASRTSLLLPFVRLVPANRRLWDHPRFLSLMDAIWPGEEKQVLGPYGWQPGNQVGLGEAPVLDATSSRLS